MKIGIVDVDGHNFPNLALMKLSAFHKKNGDNVEFAMPLFGKYDRIYMSKVFTFTPDCNDPYECEVIRAGTGYNDYKNVLSYEIEHIMPDYSLYKFDYSLGFLTRGCINNCKWCVVPFKEGDIRENADIEEFYNKKSQGVILLDNNVLASQHGINQIEKITKHGIKIDFNQGLDCRLIAENKDIAKLLARVKWIKYIRMAFDSSNIEDYVIKAIENLQEAGMKKYKMFFYVLVTKDITDAEKRVELLRRYGVNPFVQPYRDFDNKININQEQKKFARYVNRKEIFKSCTFDQYKYNN